MDHDGNKLSCLLEESFFVVERSFKFSNHDDDTCTMYTVDILLDYRYHVSCVSSFFV